jgi:hypothetical protein
MANRAPKVFISYSHVSQAHKDWVLTMATRLVANGVDVILDQWNLSLGGDLPRFMALGLTDADRVLAICSSSYVTKANAGQGGTGFETMILTAQVLGNVTTDRIIPVIRGNETGNLVPIFLSSRIYIDFRDDTKYEERYSELIREIHGVKIRPRPALGKNPFDEQPQYATPTLSTRTERYVSPALSGVVTFDVSNNNGRYVLGAGDMLFETMWTVAGNTAIHVYNDLQSIRSVALAQGVRTMGDIEDASTYDTSSRARTPILGQIVVWQNTAGYYAATRVEGLKCRLAGDSTDEVTFSYVIQPDRTSSFKCLTNPSDAVSIYLP